MRHCISWILFGGKRPPTDTRLSDDITEKHLGHQTNNGILSLAGAGMHCGTSIVGLLSTHQADEQTTSKAPGSGADCERSECSTGPRKRRPRDRYRTGTAGGSRRDAVSQWFHGGDQYQEGRNKKVERTNRVFTCTIHLLFVCTEIHSREHRPHKSPPPTPELPWSSKRDPCRAQLPRTTPSPPGNAVPGVLKHTHTRG